MEEKALATAFSNHPKSQMLCTSLIKDFGLWVFFVQDPKMYVQTILDVHRKYNALVLTSFTNDSGFVAALDKVGRWRLPPNTENWHQLLHITGLCRLWDGKYLSHGTACPLAFIEKGSGVCYILPTSQGVLFPALLKMSSLFLFPFQGLWTIH